MKTKQPIQSEKAIYLLNKKNIKILLTFPN